MKILIVEDEVTIARFLTEILRPIASEISVAYTWREAKEALARIPPPDVVTLDLSLPDSAIGDTIRQIATIKIINPLATVIVVSGVASPAYIAASEQSADAFLEKRDALKGMNLLSAIKASFEKRGYAHNLAAQEVILKAMQAA